jgi:hypothetical protein
MVTYIIYVVNESGPGHYSQLDYDFYTQYLKHYKSIRINLKYFYDSFNDLVDNLSKLKDQGHRIFYFFICDIFNKFCQRNIDLLQFGERLAKLQNFGTFLMNNKFLKDVGSKEYANDPIFKSQMIPGTLTFPCDLFESKSYKIR